MQTPQTEPWWTDLDDVLEQPAADYLGRLAATNNRLFAALKDRMTRHPEPTIDQQQMDDWYGYMSNREPTTNDRTEG